MLITSDSHFGKVQDTVKKHNMPSRVYDTAMRLVELVNYAHRKKEPVIIAGDIFDTYSPNPFIISVFFSILQYASQKGVIVYIIPGNHDAGIDYHSLYYISGKLAGKFWEGNIKVITNPCVMTIENRKVLFLPHVVKTVVDAIGYQEWVLNKLKKEDTKNIDIVIGHAHLNGAVNSSEIEIEAGEAIHFNPSNFFKYKIGVFGHIHKFQQLGKNYYCGPICTNSFDEAKVQKGFIHIDKKMNVKFIPYLTAETEYREIQIDLVNKDKIVFDPERMEKIARDKILKIVVYARDLLQINQTEIKKKFDEYGTVVRFETKLKDKYNGEIDTEDYTDDIYNITDYKPILKEWLDSKPKGEIPLDIKKLALKLGNEIIEEVLHAQ